MNIISQEAFFQNLLELTKQIKKNPEMYIGEKSLTKLDHFLGGLAIAYGYLDAEKKYFGVYPGFQEWIQKKYRIESTQSWCHILLFYSVSESSAFDLFFKRLEEFYNTTF